MTGEQSDIQVTESVTTPSTEVKPEDVGTLSLRYVDGAPHLVVSGGAAVPAVLPVVDGSGQPVANYTAGAAAVIRTRQGQGAVEGELFYKKQYNDSVRHIEDGFNPGAR
ncbi:hypothetical protein LUR56_00965 [Streptomyces sp. MT29]|nr:hypothetical protein [Streptomyces sp. MT29]